MMTDSTQNEEKKSKLNFHKVLMKLGRSPKSLPFNKTAENKPRELSSRVNIITGMHRTFTNEDENDLTKMSLQVPLT